jgi:hypothetical protein
MFLRRTISFPANYIIAEGERNVALRTRASKMGASP